jgi:hypothetical protein
MFVLTLSWSQPFNTFRQQCTAAAATAATAIFTADGVAVAPILAVNMTAPIIVLVALLFSVGIIIVVIVIVVGSRTRHNMTFPVPLQDLLP